MTTPPSSPPSSSEAAFRQVHALEEQVKTDGACTLPGVSIAYELFMPIMMRAVARGYVRQEHADFVADGLRFGFGLGVDVSKLRGRRLFRNYPTAVEARAAVSKATRARVEQGKTLRLFPFRAEDRAVLDRWPSWRIFPMGAVPKPMEPGAMRPFSDHTATGMKDATDLALLRHTLTALVDIARFLRHMYFMRVSDVDSAFPLLPIAPRLWRYMMFIWFDVHAGDEAGVLSYLYLHVCGDFGSAGLPGTWKIFFTDVVMGMARSEMVLTLEAPIYVDDISLIGELQRLVDHEGAALTAFLRMLGIFIKEIKDRAAAQVQLALGFWWDSINRTRTLSERKQQAYVAMLREFETRRSLSLRERQQMAGRMQRAVMTMPPGAACFMATMYALMRGLSLPWQSRRTTRAERLDFRCLRELLQRNLGRGFFSLDQFGEAPVVDTDASKSRAYTGGGYASRCGRYRFWRYGAAAQRNMIDFLEGDVVVEAVRDLGHLWHRKVVTFRIDNSAFQKSAVKGWSRAERLTLLLRRLFELCMQFECVLCFEWLSTRANVYADALSRVDGEAAFLRLVAETDFLPPSVFLRRDPRCGAVRQLGDAYSSNSNKDGPPRAQQNLALSVPYRRASVFVGLPNEGVADQVDEVMDTRLGASSHRSIQAALTHWDAVRARFGWPRLILSDDSERGGKLATFVLYMAEDTDLVGASISNYVWAFRSWLKFQRQLDPIYGVVDWEDFMQGVAVRTWVPAEPRKKVELWWIRGALRRVDRTSFVAVQATVVMLMLLFTFARSESPLALAFTGENAFNADKQMQVKDVRVVSKAVHVRLKGIKQDPRMQRPEAAGNEDWIVIGDVPGSDFSIMFWVQLLFSFHQGARDQDAPFFVDRDRRRPYLYSKATVDIRALWAAVVGQAEADSCGLHGLRVAGYDAARRGPGGEELAVAQGAWRSTAYRRYDRFDEAEVRGLAAAIVDQLVEPDASNPFPRERPEPQGVPLVSSSSSSLWPQGPPQPRATEGSVPTGPGRRQGGRTAAASSAAATPSSTGTRIPNRTRVEVDWSGEWYSGLTTSQRAEGGVLLTRVLYDAAGVHRAQACYHNLDIELWRPEAS